ncbi:uncharacterized protein LOC122389502 [Amphibalanus amphitrite]|uniref:uncharacterized protein LOC122389502 n=1 Tax=Amphibalanus amphitrite TaxID=1232801 RepID=UPI001C911D31|nr:uncharacterized protein LOC122389502 [Amphibalanus amphitrite]
MYNSSHGDRDGEIEDEEQHCDEEERPSDGPPRPNQGRCQELEPRGAAHSRSDLNKKHAEERRQQEQEHGKEWQELDERHYEERIELHQQHGEDTRCINMPTEDQLRQLDRSHQKQWEELLQTLQQQCRELEQRHQRESRELEQRRQREPRELEQRHPNEDESDEERQDRRLSQRLFEASERHRRQQLQLSERHRQELEEQESRHRQERKDLERRLSRRRWGLQEQQLRAVANGYVRGAIEHAAAAWLPAVSKSNIEILEREMRAVARIVTGCIHSAPHHGVTAEAGMLPVARLKLVTGWRQVGREALRELRVELPVEALLPERPPPWTPTGKITFNLSIGALPAGAARSTKRDVALHHLASMTQCATWAWTDGSSSDGILRGGAGALIVGADDSRTELRVPAGTLCSSFRAEMVALQVTLDHILEHQRDAPEPVIICTDSLSAVAALREGPSAQRSARGAAIWKQLLELTAGDRTVTLQWVPSHCGIPENESADALANEAATLAQEDVMLDCRNLDCPAARCPLCGEQADTPRHILLTCPGLMGVRLRIPAVGNILPTVEEVRRGDTVAALVAAFRALQS